MKVNVILKELEIEMTRRCNDKCKHCMRGEAQNIDISLDIINKIFNQDDYKITYIESMYLTGGEPFLNKEGMRYLIKCILNNQIHVKNIFIVINALNYDQNIMTLLTILKNMGINVRIQIIQDQFHTPVPQNNLDKYKKYSFVEYYKEYKSKNKILNFGRALENDLGDQNITEEVFEIFNKIPASLKVFDLNNAYEAGIESLYVTVNGKFGSAPTSASWQMIDNKYYLDITKDSIFKDCLFNEDNILEKVKKGYVMLPSDRFKEDYFKAKEEKCLDIFLNSLTLDKIRDYLISKKPLVRELIQN